MKLRTLIACDILLRNPQNHVSIVKFIGLGVNYLRFIPPKFLLSPLFWIIPCTCKTCMNLSWTYGSIIGNIWNDEIITWLRYDFTQPVQLTLDFILFSPQLQASFYWRSLLAWYNNHWQFNHRMSYLWKMGYAECNNLLSLSRMWPLNSN